MVLSQSAALELSESQKAVLQKYLVEGETTWEEVAQRVARYVSSAEDTPELRRYWQDKFYSILLPMKLVPGGSILANCDHGTRGLLNCFVLSAEDNIYGITKLVSDSVLTTKFRGGVGINIGSKGQKGYIRHKGAPFQDGKALGPCAVLDMVSENSKKITTGNKARRGAFLFSMDWRHPDIWEFVQAKTQSTIDAQVTKSIIESMAQLVLSDVPEAEKRQKLRELNTELATAWVETHLNPEGKRDRRWHNANISVQLDDEFFRRLDAGDEFANQLWDKIAEFAHATADPGLLLIDNAKRRSPIREFVTCTNPCVTGETWVHTGDGPRQVKNLVGKQHSTYVNGELFSTTPAGFWSTGQKKVFSLQTREGYRLRLTGNHRILRLSAQTRQRQYTDWVEAQELQPGDRIMLHDHRGLTPWDGQGTTAEGWLLGMLVGESSLFTRNPQKAMAVLGTWEDTFPGTQNPYRVRKATGLNQQQLKQLGVYSLEVAELAQSYGISPKSKQITPAIEQASFNFYRGFLQGLFDADGQVQGGLDREAMVCLSKNNLSLLEAVQRMLLRLGIVSTLRKKRRSSEQTASPYSLLISKDNIRAFQELVGFQHDQKAARLAELCREPHFNLDPERFVVTVESLVADGIEPVFDCTVPGPACFDANGLVAHNCGEIFLPPNSACNLSSLVLTKFVTPRADGSIEIDWEDLAETVRISVRFLDNVLSISEFATPDQKHNVRNVFRQLGLGIMGWADYLKLARIPYDTPEHLMEIDRWGSWIATHAYRTSEALAQEKGECGIWPEIADIRTGNPFERWVDSEGNEYDGSQVLNSNRQDLKQMSRRNSTVLSIAPTGSIAQLAACSWAFEPDFGLTLYKQVFVDASRSQQNWVQILNPYLDELELSEADQEIVKRTGSLKGTEFARQRPEVAASFKIAREVPPGWHILVQSKWQDWIDSSISKTINLPGHATVAEIKQIYRLAEKAGLKGVTVYRSGTLESEPIKVGDEERKDG